MTASTDTGTLDHAFAVRWYQSWIDAWNSHDPEQVKAIVTDDFVLDSPTTRHTGWHVQGPQAASDYVRYVLGAYPDLIWEVVAPPMFADGLPRAAFSWRGTGHFSGTLTPPGIPGNGRAFAFAGLEVFDFRGDRACYLNASYDLLGLMRQIGVYRGATADGRTR
ncbi:ester cyclase [Pseudonocardia sp. GCM10023141]|uniref:ester cyclase n=1 Tax=Pseudonocardia sp. GCM10023141 TaxID=3252653 RepID=UPI003607F278